MTAGSLVDKGRQSRIGTNALLNSFGSFAYSLAVILVTPVALRFLGEDLWGVWQLVGAVTAYALLVNLGLNSSVSYFVSRAMAVDDLDLFGATLHTARVYLAAAGGVVLVVFLTLGWAFVTTVVEPAYHQPAFAALGTSMVVTAFTLPARQYSSVLSGLQRYDLLTWFRIVTGVLLVAGAWVGFELGMGIVGFVILMSLAPILPSSLGWLMLQRILPAGSMAWRSVDRAFLGEMIRYSLNTLAYTAGTVVLFQSVKLIASWRCGGAAAAGHIGLAINVVHVVSVLFLPLAGVLHTRLSDLHMRGLWREGQRLVRQSVAGIALLAVPSTLFLIVEARVLLHAWLGSSLDPSTLDAIATTTRRMLVGEGFYVLSLPFFYALVGVGQHRVFGAGVLGAGTVNAMVGWVAAGHTPQIETLGLVFGAVLVLLVLVVTVPVALRHFKLGLGSVVRDAFLIPCLVSLPGLAGLYARPSVDPPLLDLVVAGLCFGVPVLPGLWLARRRL